MVQGLPNVMCQALPEKKFKKGIEPVSPQTKFFRLKEKMNKTSRVIMGKTKQDLTARPNTIEDVEKGTDVWKRLLQSLALMLVMWVALQPATADAQTCGTPGKDGAGGTLTGVKNTYYPGTASVVAGTSASIALGAATGATTPIASGDMLLVMQMQDAAINSADTSRYGDGVNGLPASGYTAANSTGLYEFITASIGVPLTGGTLTFVGTGTSSRLVNSYTDANATGTQGQRRFQIIRVPQYTTATLGSTLTALAWNGTTGGVLAIDVSGILTLGGATVSVSGLGFRPGAGRQLAGGGGSNTDYRNVATNNAHGQKGEGIAGTPRYMYIASSGLILDTTVEGYPNGSTAMGAPGNAGGGATDGNPAANDQNSGGGGGGNGGAGGIGGKSWSSNIAVGGFGGAAFAQAAAARLVMGGGGGGGSRNNTPGVVAAASGGAGGGMIFIRAGSISGTGTLSARGADAYNDTLNDGGGGGGAGGSVLFWVKVGTLTGLTVNANGGEGGDAWRTQAPNGTPGERHGPGGGGGGGVVLLSSAATAVTVAGGGNGITTTANDAYGSAPGAVGVQSTTLTAAQIPGVSSGATCTLAPSAVELITFEATGYNGYVVLQWQTGYEADNLGFNIYRDEDGQRQRLTKSLIAGSALITGTVLTSGNSYSWTDHSTNSKASYWLEDVDLDGTTTWHGPIVASDPPYDETEPVVHQTEPLFQMRDAQSIEMVGAESSQIDLSAPVSHKAKSPKITAGLLFAQSAVAAFRAAKISVKQEGWYRVTEAELAGIGFKITAPQHLQLFADGQEQPFILKGDKAGSFTIEFYGVGLDTTWTATRVYWLVNATSPGLRIRSVQEAGSATAASSFQYTVERSDRNIYFPALKNGDVDNFFGPVVAAAGAEQALTLKHVDPDMSKSANVEVRLQGLTMAAHEVRVLLNGVELGIVSFNGQDQGLGKYNVSQSVLKEGDNRVSLTALRGSTDVDLGVYTRVTYWHSYKADNGGLRFTANAKEQLAIEGFNGEDVRVVDITSPNSPLEVVGTVKQQENGYAISVVAPGSGKRTLLAFGTETVKRPAAIRPDQPSSLRRKGIGADLVIITTEALRDSLEPLKALRQSQGMSVAIVDVEDIYDEFSFGVKTPQSVKDFLSYARTNWSPAPRFVLLAGDATYDPRNYTGAGDNDLIPTKLVSTVAKESPSDDWFADFDGDGLAEMAVGRLPVRTPQDAAIVVGKIVSYDRTPATNSALLVNDWNTGYNFQEASLSARSLIPATTPVVQVDRMVMSDSAAKAAIIENLNQGPKLVNYLGHGSVGIWNGNLFTSTDAKALRNRDQLSVYLMMTCYTGWFLDPTNDGLAEVLLKSADGGAAAVWASSGLTEAAGQVSINQDLLKSLFSGKLPTTIGEAIQKAKATTGDSDVRSTWTLFGDPSMKLR